MDPQRSIQLGWFLLAHHNLYIFSNFEILGLSSFLAIVSLNFGRVNESLMFSVVVHIKQLFSNWTCSSYAINNKNAAR